MQDMQLKHESHYSEGIIDYVILLLYVSLRLLLYMSYNNIAIMS